MLTLDIGPLALSTSHLLLLGSLLLATLVGWWSGRRLKFFLKSYQYK